ncbi:MAG: hydantoinase B/oxoprolinase family protein [Chloroflexi bacterium]|nr:hydantoinase B/oxoprolinase family protein [Chloroflexota bacterium]MCL5075401.1 hydantoinase B/oxoprolinase family protein [Chloroflexota bacterium]
MDRVDPVTVEVVLNALISAALEMGVGLQRTAYSTIIREEKDCSCAVFGPEGELVAQAEFIPIHLGSMEFGLKEIIAEYSAAFEPGDIYASNHPYRGAQHTPDIMMFSPVFYGDELVGFVGNVAHHIDVGGNVPGSVGGNNTELFQEGLVIPPLKIYAKDEMGDWFRKMIAANVREPDKTLGDLRAQVVANKIGERRFLELLRNYGTAIVRHCIRRIVDYSEQRMRAEISGIPNGRYVAEEYMDGDGQSDAPVRIVATVVVDGTEIWVDFTGTDEQVRGAVNSPLTATRSAVYYAIRCLTDPEIPQNHGCLRPIHVLAPSGTVVNPISPAACGGRMQPCYRIVDVIFQALAPAIPDKVVAGSHGNTVISIGGRGITENKHYVFFEVVAGGYGARSNKDGIGGVDVHLSNCMNAPIEAIEIEYPLLLESYELEPNSGGVGKYRGGQGIRRDIRFLGDEATLMIRSDKVKFGPKGMLGGGEGRPGLFVLNPNTKEQRILQSKTTTFIKKGNLISLRTPGGGGYGAPEQRPPGLLEKDLIEGRVIP